MRTGHFCSGLRELPVGCPGRGLVGACQAWGSADQKEDQRATSSTADLSSLRTGAGREEATAAAGLCPTDADQETSMRLARVAVYVAVLTEAGRWCPDWMDIEASQVQQLQTTEEREATRAQCRLWRRAGASVCRRFSDCSTEKSGRRVKSENGMGGRRYRVQEEDGPCGTSVPRPGRHGPDGGDQLWNLKSCSTLETVRSWFLTKLILLTPSGRRYIASLHTAWPGAEDRQRSSACPLEIIYGYVAVRWVRPSQTQSELAPSLDRGGLLRG